MSTLIDKLVAYRTLVEERKACRVCAKLTNPADCPDGPYDSDQIGPWTLWQGNLNSELMVVGQDWGDQRYFVDNRGRDLANNPTNSALQKLLESIGFNIEKPTPQDCGGGKIFLTNAVLCLKQEDGMQGKTDQAWFKNCRSLFLRPTIEILRPRIVVTLGERAYRAVAAVYGIKSQPFRAAVEFENGFELEVGIRLFPVYHCGARILNTHRKMGAQIRDWGKIGKALARVPLANAGWPQDPAPPSARM